MQNYQDKEYKIFKSFASGLVLACAGDLRKHNACTIGWGSMGTLWTGKNGNGNVLTIYIHPARYTSKLLDENKYFSVCFFNDKYKKELAYMGTKSGRDEDKTKGSGLTLLDLDKTIGYKEADTIFVCRKLYSNFFNKECLTEDVKNYYINNPKAFPLDEDGNWNTHKMCVGEIVEVIENN